MVRSVPPQIKITRITLSIATAVVSTAVWLLFPATQLQAQTFAVLHQFTGGADGESPGGTGITIDRAGNLYGGAENGGLQEPQCYLAGTCGTIFKLSHRGSGWIFDLLYSFHGTDGDSPNGPLVFGPDGALYGTTFYGGLCRDGCGNVFRLQPPPSFCASISCPWTETVLYQFTDGNDGGQPSFGALLFDSAGNLYGTTTHGGEQNCGTVFELARNGNQWTFDLLWTLNGYLDGCLSLSGVISDAAGNLYGATLDDGANAGGTAFELTRSGQQWTLIPIHQFVPSTDGAGSLGNLAFDHSGNLLGTNEEYGPGQSGGVWELSPSGRGWNFSVLHSFFIHDSFGPGGPVLVDSAGNLYGTSVGGGSHGRGLVFKMTPTGSGYTYTELYDFTGGADGQYPYGQLAMDANGNLYGVAQAGGLFGGECGTYGCGTVWELTP